MPLENSVAISNDFAHLGLSLGVPLWSIERRQRERIHGSFAALVRGADESGHRWHEEGHILNISAKGAFLELPRTLKLRNEIFVVFQFPQHDKVPASKQSPRIAVRGIVRRVEISATRRLQHNNANTDFLSRKQEMAGVSPLGEINEPQIDKSQVYGPHPAIIFNALQTAMSNETEGPGNSEHFTHGASWSTSLHAFGSTDSKFNSIAKVFTGAAIEFRNYRFI